MNEHENKTLVQLYLVDHTLNDLEEAHGVKSRISDCKVSLNYSQLEAVDGEPLSQQCRGLILRKEDGSEFSEDKDEVVGETKVLARPFYRFFNYGQEAAASVDFSSPNTRFYEKVDGTCTIVYFDDLQGKWHVATRSVAEADLPIDGFDNDTFRDLFVRAMKETTGLTSFDEFAFSYLNKYFTYIFELTTPENQIVVKHEKYGITLLGARDTGRGDEVPVEVAGASIKNIVPVVKSYKFGDVSEMLAFVNSLDGKEHEGVVACDEKFNRVKVKNAEYCAINRLSDSVCNSTHALMVIILDEKLDDIVAYVPERIVEKGNQIQENLRSFAQKQRKIFDECMDVAYCVKEDGGVEAKVRKAFALAVLARDGHMPSVMSMFKGDCTSFYGWIALNRSETSGWSKSFTKRLYRNLE